MILNACTLLDFALLLCVFLGAAGWASHELTAETLLGILILILAWISSTALTRKFNQTYRSESLADKLAPFTKGSVLMLMFVWIVQQVFSITEPIMATALVFSVIEMLVVFVLLLLDAQPEWFIQPAETGRTRSKSAQTDLDLESEDCAKPTDAGPLLLAARVQQAEIVSRFVNRTIHFEAESSGTGRVLGRELHDDYVGQSSLGISAFRLNDVRRLNKYLLRCYENIASGGWIVVWYTPLHRIESCLRGRSQGEVRFLFHFLFHRFWPRMPGINRAYFALTRGRNRALSKAEVWGRLHYCGFEVLDEMNAGGCSYVVARKTRTPSRDKNPSYYPVIKLARVGKGGKIVPVYKVRSMHPYSEYIQKKIFEQNNLNNKGKFQDDFRRTGWGIFLRKHWLDEIPQLLDWLRGDLKLVGICAMSEHYFSLYSKKYQELFKRVKPGVVPPLMDENTQGFDQIQEIEQTYLESYLERPLKTDLTYLWKTFSQIALKGGSSG